MLGSYSHRINICFVDIFESIRELSSQFHLDLPIGCILIVLTFSTTQMGGQIAKPWNKNPRCNSNPDLSASNGKSTLQKSSSATDFIGTNQIKQSNPIIGNSKCHAYKCWDL